MDIMDNIAETLRPVGKLERWSTVRHYLNFYTNVGITARYAGQHKLTRETLYSALGSLIATHACLGITFLNEDSPEPWFARLKKIDLDEVVTFVELSTGEQDEIDKFLEKEHNVQFKDLGRLPPWRIVVFESKASESTDVAFIYHHGLGDGGTGKAFHGILLKALNNPSKDAATPLHVIVPPEISLLPPLESLVSLPISYLHLFKKLWARVWFQSDPPPTFWCGDVIKTPLKTLYRTVLFAPKTMDGVLVACRREKTTVTALLQVLSVKAFFDELPNPDASPVTSMASVIPINFRRYIPGATAETMGVFVASLKVMHTRTEMETVSVWELARRCKAVLDERVNAGTRDTDTGLLKYLSDYEGYLHSRLGQRREESVELSNIGLFKGEDGEWSVKRMVFSQGSSVTGCAVELSVVSVKGGEMCVGVSVQEGIVEEELMGRVVERLRREVEAAGVV